MMTVKYMIVISRAVQHSAGSGTGTRQ